MFRRTFKPGDFVVFRKTKFSTSPGPRAKSVIPSRFGDDYRYEVDKFRVVAERYDDETLLLQTRRGKQHLVSGVNPNLRPAKWWERSLFGNRFPRLTPSAAA